MTRKGRAVHTVEPVPTAIVSGFGGRYSVEHSASPGRIRVWDDRGNRVYPESDGSYCLAHPDLETDGISSLLRPSEVHEAAWGRRCAGGTVCEDGAVYDTNGYRRPVVRKAVGWSGRRDAEQPAVRIGNELCLISDLVRSAWGGGALVSSTREPFTSYGDDDE